MSNGSHLSSPLSPPRPLSRPSSRGSIGRSSSPSVSLGDDTGAYSLIPTVRYTPLGDISVACYSPIPTTLSPSFIPPTCHNWQHLESFLVKSVTLSRIILTGPTSRQGPGNLRSLGTVSSVSQTGRILSTVCPVSFLPWWGSRVVCHNFSSSAPASPLPSTSLTPKPTPHSCHPPEHLHPQAQHPAPASPAHRAREHHPPRSAPVPSRHPQLPLHVFDRPRPLRPIPPFPLALEFWRWYTTCDQGRATQLVRSTTRSCRS